MGIIKDRTNETSIASNGQKMTIIEYIKSKDLSIQFEDGAIVYNKDYRNFKHRNGIKFYGDRIMD